MPEKGYSSITVSNEVYERLRRHARETHRTVPKLIEHLLDRFFPEGGEEAGPMVAVSVEELRSRWPRRGGLRGVVALPVARLAAKPSKTIGGPVFVLWHLLERLWWGIARDASLTLRRSRLPVDLDIAWTAVEG